tara:strand:- start:139 stop:261 length:123 start_codon:yes stop_codon:yes gene_type:complete
MDDPFGNKFKKFANSACTVGANSLEQKLVVTAGFLKIKKV